MPLILTIFDGENTGEYLVDTISADGHLKIDGTFKTTTKPGNFEKFAIHTILNTISG